ncbi:MAG TPA: hypothetical protein DDY17_00885 [Syntrophaceae bacterium]|jgi:murein lipoprotein|nr:hypothetical protein [Syntrophaceae bacterium]
MKKSLLVLSIMLALAVSVMGCATTGDLEKMQTQLNQLDAKIDQALQASQDAKTAANETRANLATQVEQANAAAMKADAAASRAENAAKKSMK